MELGQRSDLHRYVISVIYLPLFLCHELFYGYIHLKIYSTVLIDFRYLVPVNHVFTQVN